MRRVLTPEQREMKNVAYRKHRLNNLSYRFSEYERVLAKSSEYKRKRRDVSWAKFKSEYLKDPSEWDMLQLLKFYGFNARSKRYCRIYYYTCQYCNLLKVSNIDGGLTCCPKCRRGLPTYDKVCIECDNKFVGFRNKRYCCIGCSSKYSRRISKKKERARNFTLKVDSIDPIKVFKKYKWKCAKCNVKTPAKLKGSYLNNSPVLDHIYPLSKGGLHSYSNVQLLCRECNSFKSNLTKGEQVCLL